MLRTLKDASLAARLRAGSVDLTKKYFSWDATLDSTMKVFGDALETAAVRAPA